VVLLQKSNQYVSGLFQKKITVARQPKSLLGSILKVRFKLDFEIDFKLKNWHKDKFLVDKLKIIYKQMVLELSFWVVGGLWVRSDKIKCTAICNGLCGCIAPLLICEALKVFHFSCQFFFGLSVFLQLGIIESREGIYG